MSDEGNEPAPPLKISVTLTGIHPQTSKGRHSPVPFSVEEKRGVMAESRILPLGFIDSTTEDGAIIMLTRPSDSHTLQPETPVTLLSRSRREITATARVRGLITDVGYVTAAFRVEETRMDARWPAGEEILRRGEPVYQAIAESFERDPARAISRELAEGLGRLAARYRSSARPKEPQPERARKPSRNGTHPPDSGEETRAKT